MPMAALAAAASAVSAGAPSTAPLPALPHHVRSEENYMLQCRGCHRPDGGGSQDTTPPLAGSLARFLKVTGGREYLVQVPGVATAPLSDTEVAELLNWTLYRFDRANVPADFVPYSPAEVAWLRRAPLRAEAGQVRARLVQDIEKATKRGARAGPNAKETGTWDRSQQGELPDG
jgi:cytochrome c553